MEHPPYKFTGKEEDPETGLIYFGARYYDAAVGIWHGVDPLAEKYAQYSPYNYCLNNPIILTDPDGQDPIFGRNGQLIGYRVEKGQGPTQIAKDLNNNYDCLLKCPVKWTEVVQDNKSFFKNVYESKKHNIDDKYNPLYKSGNINPGDILVIDNGKIVSLPQYEEKLKSLIVKIKSIERKIHSESEDHKFYEKKALEYLDEPEWEGGQGAKWPATIRSTKSLNDSLKLMKQRDVMIKQRNAMQKIINEIKNVKCDDDK